MSAPMLMRRRELTSPKPEKIRGTLLDTVQVREGILYGEPGGLYLTVNCLDTDAVTTMCPTTEGTKTFEGPSVVDGIRVATYTGISCKLIGWAENEQEAELTRLVELRESMAVERALMQERFTGIAGGTIATNLTPSGGAVAPKVGLAILEGHAGVHYAGVPTIHSPRSIATLLYADGMVDTDSSASGLRTPLGSKLVAGAGYEVSNGPDASTPAAGETWMYVTGEVGVSRSPLLIRNELDRSTNDNYVLGERIYVVDVDCYVAAVRVKIA